MWIKDNKSYEMSFQNWYKVFVLWDTIVSKLEATAYFVLSLFVLIHKQLFTKDILILYPRLALDFQSSCFIFPEIRVIGIYHYTQ